jgi:hypothetical protein
MLLHHNGMSLNNSSTLSRNRKNPTLAQLQRDQTQEVRLITNTDSVNFYSVSFFSASIACFKAHNCSEDTQTADYFIPQHLQSRTLFLYSSSITEMSNSALVTNDIRVATEGGLE